MLARLRDKGLGLAPVVRGGRVIRPQRAALAAPVADLSLLGPIPHAEPVRPADRLTALRAEGGLLLAVEFEIDLSKLPEWADARISANDRRHRQGNAKRTKLWRKAGKLAASHAWQGVPLEWARLVVLYRFPDNRRRETSNLQPTSKAIVDGLVDAGLLLDDRDEMVDGPDNRRLWPNGEHRVVVQVWRRA